MVQTEADYMWALLCALSLRPSETSSPSEVPALGVDFNDWMQVHRMWWVNSLSFCRIPGIYNPVFVTAL